MMSPEGALGAELLQPGGVRKKLKLSRRMGGRTHHGRTCFGAEAEMQWAARETEEAGEKHASN